MPTSEHWQIPWVLDVIAREQPRSILDVGAGYGKFGFLAREYANPERVDAIDVHPPRFPAYDRVMLGDLARLEELLPKEQAPYDLALFVDVIEHLEKPAALSVLDQLTRRARRVLVTTPWGFRPQEIPGQPFETHRSGWYPWEFARRYRLHQWRIFPGHFSRYLKIPRLWQILVVVGARESP